MKIGVPAEVKNHEYRVAATPAGVHELVRHGHDVFVQRGAGLGSQITDEEYLAAGAKILDTADEVWASAEMVLKVKEPIAEEYPRMRPGQVLFTYLHLAASQPCTDALIANKVTAIAYETVQVGNSLPLLAPMSEVAGRLAPQVGAYNLMRFNGGRGVLPGGVPGVAPAKVVVIGGGVSGLHAAQIAVGMGADVTILDTNVDRLRYIDAIYQGRLKTLVSNAYAIEQEVLQADLVIGAVLIPGAKAPTLVSNDLVSRMKPGSVLVDIAIDQGGCFEDSQRHPAVRGQAGRQGLEGRAPRRRRPGPRPQHARRPAHQRPGRRGAGHGPHAGGRDPGRLRNLSRCTACAPYPPMRSTSRRGAASMPCPFGMSAHAQPAA